jgi:ParB family chromosome partitioning protein
MLHSTSGMRSLSPQREVVPTARSGRDITSCCLAMTSADRATDALTQTAIRLRLAHTSPSRLRQSRSSSRSAPAYGKQQEGSKVLPRNQYTTIRDEKPKSKEEAKRPEFKVCKFTTEAIIAEGIDVGTVHKVCASPTCPVHHPKQEKNSDGAKWKAEQEKQRKEQAIANTTGIRVLKAIGDAVPVRLMKRDLLFVLIQTFPLLNEWQLQTLARQHGIRKDRETDLLDKMFTAFLRRADERTLSRLLVEVSVVVATGRSNGANALREAATVYKVDTDAIALKVKQEFAAKAKAKKQAKPETLGTGKSRKAA